MPYALLNLVVGLVIVGLLLWAINQIPMDPTIAKVIRVVVIVMICLWLLYWPVGFVPGYPGFFPATRR